MKTVYESFFSLSSTLSNTLLISKNSFLFCDFFSFSRTQFIHIQYLLGFLWGFQNFFFLIYFPNYFHLLPAHFLFVCLLILIFLKCLLRLSCPIICKNETKEASWGLCASMGRDLFRMISWGAPNVWMAVFLLWAVQFLFLFGRHLAATDQLTTCIQIFI